MMNREGIAGGGAGLSPGDLAEQAAPSEYLPAIASGLTPIAVYLHTPFCPTKCGYCDFNSYAGMELLHERTVRAICAEVRHSPLQGIPAKTIFFGGGTPTFLSAGQLRRLIEAVFEAHPPVKGCEITSEANPGTVDIPKFAAMREMGFNRISLGAQSFLDSDLERLGRVHRSVEIERAVRSARSAGFENLNLDLMFALPGQSPDGWKANLEKAISLKPEHLSLYCLTLESNTPFFKQHLRGQLVQPEEGVQVDMYDLAVSLAESAGFRQYEISNFARPGLECRHNLAYWRCEDYAGYGPGAVGCLNFGFSILDFGLNGESSFSRSDSIIGSQQGEEPGRHNAGADGVAQGDSVRAMLSQSKIQNPKSKIRYTNLKHPSRYCDAVESGADLWCESDELDAGKERLERVMLGIRLNEGLDVGSLKLSENEISGLSAQVRRLAEMGWVEGADGRIRLTSRGRHWCSEVALALA